MAYPQSVATSRAVVNAALEFTETSTEMQRMGTLTSAQTVAEFGSIDEAVDRLMVLRWKRRRAQTALYLACMDHRRETQREHVNGPNIDADRSAP